jgi:hypothetical protein
VVESRRAAVVAVLVLGTCTVGGSIPGGSTVRRDVAVLVAVVALGIGALTSLVACLPALAALVITFGRVGAVFANVIWAAAAVAGKKKKKLKTSLRRFFRNFHHGGPIWNALRERPPARRATRAAQN